MRLPQVPSSAYASPLDLLLGTPLRVRILRALDTSGDVRGAADLAKQASADPTALRRALLPLVRSGLVEQIGRGRGAVYRIRSRHPFAAPLAGLFQAEQNRKESVPQTVRAWADRADPAPVAVWLYGSVARHEDDFGSDVDLALIAPGPAAFSRTAHALVPVVARQHAERLGEQLRVALQPVSDTMQLSPNVIVLLPTELLELEVARPTLWNGLVNESRPLVGSAAPALINRLRRQQAQDGHDDARRSP